MERCGWVSQDPLYIAYHDNEWGVPETDSKKLFEMICLEGQQAGLSWITVLKKRENYRACFHQFDPVKVAAMQEEDGFGKRLYCQLLACAHVDVAIPYLAQ